MKKALTPTQGTAAVSEPWRAALRTFDQDLQRRGAAERTRRAYGTDAAELAGWATANGLNPQQVDYKVLRRWAARMSQRGAAPRTHGAQAGVDPQPLPQPARARRGRVQPGRPAARAQAPADAARRRSSRTTSRGCSRTHPGLDAARDARPRAVRARVRQRAARGGARRPRRHEHPVRRRTGPRRGQGRPRPASSRRASRRCARSPPIWSVRGRRWPAPTPTPRFSCPRAANVCRRPMSGAACACGRGTLRRRPGCTRTHSVIPSQRTCSRAARTCARSRRCSVTPASRRPRSTLG